MADRTQELYHLADELRGIARQGLAYAQNDHDRGRYERVLAAGARLVAAVGDLPDDRAAGVLEAFRENLAHVSPVAGAEAVVVRGGRLLLHRRADNGLWAMCGGLAEIGETLAEAAARELWEEARVRGRITRLLGVFDSLRWDMRTKVQIYLAVFEVESDDEPAPTAEATAFGFFGPDELPPLSPSHRLRVPVVFQVLRGERPLPFVDLPKAPAAPARSEEPAGEAPDAGGADARAASGADARISPPRRSSPSAAGRRAGRWWSPGRPATRSRRSSPG